MNEGTESWGTRFVGKRVLIVASAPSPVWDKDCSCEVANIDRTSVALERSSSRLTARSEVWRFGVKVTYHALPAEAPEAGWERSAEILSNRGPWAAGPMPRLRAERRR